MAIGLIIFDCDGVLIDSEIIACRIEAEELARHGFPYDEEELAGRFCGIPVPAMYAMMEAETGLAVPEELRLTIRQRIHQAIARDLAAVPGVHEALASIREPACVASSSGLDYLEKALTLVDLYDRFHPHVFSAQQVAHGKPAPDLFLYAASRLGIDPSDCLVVEDSVAGVQAGRAAGMRVLGFTGGGHCREGHAERLTSAGAQAVLAEMSGLSALLRSLR